MNKTEAFNKLGLTENASPDQINTQFKKLAMEFHPDKGGNDSEMTELLTARDIALSNDKSKALISIDSIKEIVLASYKPLYDQQNKRELKERTDSVINEIKNRKTSNLIFLKRTAAITGSISGGFAFVINQFLPLLKDTFTNNIISNQMPIVFGIIGAFLGFYYWITSERVKRIESLIEEVKDRLDDKSTYVDTFNSILLNNDEGYSLTTSCTRMELEDKISKWEYFPKEEEKELTVMTSSERNRLPTIKYLRYLVRKIGERDFTQILITKGLELQLLVSNELVDGNRLKVVYQLNLEKQK